MSAREIFRLGTFGLGLPRGAVHARPMRKDARWRDVDSAFSRACLEMGPDFFVSIVDEGADEEARNQFVWHEPFSSSNHDGVAVALAWKEPDVSIYADYWLWEKHEGSMLALMASMKELLREDVIAATSLAIERCPEIFYPRVNK